MNDIMQEYEDNLKKETEEYLERKKKKVIYSPPTNRMYGSPHLASALSTSFKITNVYQ